MVTDVIKNVLLFAFIISTACASPQYFYDKPVIPFSPTPKPRIDEIKASNGYNYPKPDVQFTLPDKNILGRISTIREPIVTSLRPTNPTIRSVLPTAFVKKGYVYSKPKVEFTFPSGVRTIATSPSYSPVSTSASYATFRPANPPPKPLLQTISTKKEYYYQKPKVEFTFPSATPTFTAPPFVTAASFVNFSPTNSPPKAFVPTTVTKKEYFYPKPKVEFTFPSALSTLPSSPTHSPIIKLSTFAASRPTNPPPKPFLPAILTNKGYYYPKPKVEFTFPSTASTFTTSSSYSPVITSTPFATSKPTNPPPKPLLDTTTVKRGYFYPKPKIEFTFPNAAMTLRTSPGITPTPFATIRPTNLPPKLFLTMPPKPAYIQPTFKPIEIFHPPSLKSEAYYHSTHRPIQTISTYIPSIETNFYSKPPPPPHPKPIVEKISPPSSRPTYASKTNLPPGQNSVISFSQTTPRPIKAFSFASQTTPPTPPTSRQLFRISDRPNYISPLQSTKTSGYFYPKPSIPFIFTPPASLRQSPFTPTSSTIRIVTLSPQISHSPHSTGSRVDVSPSVYRTISVPLERPFTKPEMPVYIPPVTSSTPPPPPPPKPTIEARIPEQIEIVGYNYAMRQNPVNLPEKQSTVSVRPIYSTPIVSFIPQVAISSLRPNESSVLFNPPKFSTNLFPPLPSKSTIKEINQPSLQLVGYHYPKPQIEFPLPTAPNPVRTLPTTTYGYHYNSPIIPFDS